MTRPTTRRREKLAPEPSVRRVILAAASESLREQGLRGLSVAAVLDRAQLSTRAFYRHFQSRDQLVAAVFLETAYAEMRRLRKRMAKTTDPVEAVATWVDARLDLAFDAGIKSDLRHLSLEAQSAIFASPELIQPAYTAMLEPLVEQLQRGHAQGVFTLVDPLIEAQSIQGVVWVPPCGNTCSDFVCADWASHRKRPLESPTDRGLGTDNLRKLDGPGICRIDSRCHRGQQGYGARHRPNLGRGGRQRCRHGPK
jgi:AcrR family transcriptional regulator